MSGKVYGERLARAFADVSATPESKFPYFFLTRDEMSFESYADQFWTPQKLIETLYEHEVKIAELIARLEKCEKDKNQP